VAFFTSFFLYRPTKPPRVRPAELARFVEAVAETGVVAPGHMLPTELKFGAAIDRDDKDMAIRTPLGRGLYTGGVAETGEGRARDRHLCAGSATCHRRPLL
jgi:hypothetical protein